MENYMPFISRSLSDGSPASVEIDIVNRSTAVDDMRICSVKGLCAS